MGREKTRADIMPPVKVKQDPRWNTSVCTALSAISGGSLEESLDLPPNEKASVAYDEAALGSAARPCGEVNQMGARSHVHEFEAQA
jgi:hypothetical protein